MKTRALFCFVTFIAALACAVPAVAQDSDGDGFSLADGDCDDSNPQVFPGASEICDGIDNDCDALIDDNDPQLVDGTTWCRDADSDQFGTNSVTVLACNPPSGYVGDCNDCNDSMPSIYPGATEIAGDDFDQDCDGFAACFIDADDDGFGGLNAESAAITATGGIADQGCGGSSVDGFDNDSSDCDDSNASIFPGAEEICGNFTDDNCDGFGTADDDEDFDGCSSGDESIAGTDACDDDTDNDSLVDGVELGANCIFDFNELDPLDADSDDDALGDGDEDAGPTEPLVADSDGDGLNDGLESGLTAGISGGTSIGTGVPYDGTANVWVGDSDPSTITDPDNPDSDFDGLPDGTEDINGNGAVDQGESDPRSDDSDSDTLIDGDEVFNVGTDPADADSDDDGLGDGAETSFGLDATDDDSDGDRLNDGLELGLQAGVPAQGIYGGTAASWLPDSDPNSTTDPLDADTDGDLLKDGDEDADTDGAVDTTETDPNIPDTDADGIDDFEELLCGSDPTDPLSGIDCLIFFDGFEAR